MMPASRWARRQHHTLLRPALSPRRPASPPPFSPLRRRLQAAKLSSFQLEVSEALGALGIDHELEYLTAVNLLSVDIAIVAGGEACVCGGGGSGRLPARLAAVGVGGSVPAGSLATSWGMQPLLTAHPVRTCGLV